MAKMDGRFTDEDRNRLIETHTLIKTHVGRLNDHETRLRTVETRQTKIMTVFATISAAIGSTLGATWHKFFG